MKKFENLKNIHNSETVLTIAIVISFFLGILPSIILSDWVWFSRSGALLVIFGIYMVWLDYNSGVNNDLDTLLSGFSEYLIKDTEHDEGTIKVIEENVSSKFNEVREATKKRVKNIEFFTFAIGTLIWGYGDLINKILDQSC